MLKFVCYKWCNEQSNKNVYVYKADHVNRLYNMLERKLRQPFELYCITDDSNNLNPFIKTIPLPVEYKLWGERWCLVWSFSEEMKELVGDRFAVLDLDVVIVDYIDDLFDNDHDIVLMKGTSKNKTPYNTGFIYMKAGSRRLIWDFFDVELAVRLQEKTRYVGTAQSWVGAFLREEAVWSKKEGVYAYRLLKDKENLPENAKIVFFPGAKDDPSQTEVQKQSPWILEHWR